MLERATLEAFDSGSYTATVRFAGSLSSVVAARPVPPAIPRAAPTPGPRAPRPTRAPRCGWRSTTAST